MLEAAVAALLPPGIAVAVRDPALPVDQGEVFASEAAEMARAVPKRRAEFFAGRAAAHQAMRALGHLPTPVAMGKDRAPVWPDGLSGSISHCAGACVALMAEASRYRALAVDIEPDADLPVEVIGVVCLPSERAWLAELPVLDRGRMARLIFSAKETVYKLQYPITGKMLDFSDVEIVVNVDDERFDARFTAPYAPDFADALLAGWFGREGGKVFSVMFAE